MFEKLRTGFPYVTRTSPLEQSKIRRGRFFTTAKIFTGILNNGKVEILVKTGPNFSHITKFMLAAGGDSILEIFEDTIVSVDGSVLFVANNNCDSTLTADGTHFFTPTITDEGTLVVEEYIPGGSGPMASGGVNPGAEFLLKKSSNYLIRGTNVSGNTKTMCIGASFFEE